MTGNRDELGKLFRAMGASEMEEDDESARRMRALSGLASLLRAAEQAREYRRARGNHLAAPEKPAPDGSNVVRLTVPAR